MSNSSSPDAEHAPAALIGLDWGTSSLRAFRMDAAGRVLESWQWPWGIMNLPQEAGTRGGGSPHAGFELAFDAACGNWLSVQPSLPVIACGMVGSAQGWKEAPYVELPSGLHGLARSLTRLQREAGAPVHIVPGVIQRGMLPNVMRGEETQVIGVLDGLALEPDETVLVGLPGTHSKWVTARGAGLLHFDTFMTGEVYAALRGHTILGRTMQAGAVRDDAAFARGLKVARSGEGALGVLSNIFSCRTLGLTGELSPTAQADYLSGLLIGHEVAALARGRMQAGKRPRVVLCGEPELCRRYADALERFGLGTPGVAAQATARGLWRIAAAAGLVADCQSTSQEHRAES